MLVWCMTLFGLGVLAFLDTFFNYGEIFRRANSILFMLLSLGLLIRTKMLIKFGRLEGLMRRNSELEDELTQRDQETTRPVVEPEKAY